MKRKKCPYCSRSISYFTVFHEKKHGLYYCARCRKESKIKTDKRLVIAFLAVVLAVVLYIIFWIGSDFRNQFIGIIPPIAALLIFYFCTPLFIRFVPLKEYLNTEKKQPEINEPVSGDVFKFDKDTFDRIKNSRSASSDIDSKIDIAAKEQEEHKVHEIKNVSEAHASYDAPLKRVPRQSKQADYPQPYEEEKIKTYVPKKSKPDGSKYTANRKF